MPYFYHAENKAKANKKQRHNPPGTPISDSRARSVRKAYVLSAVLRVAPEPGQEGKGTQWKHWWEVRGLEEKGPISKRYNSKGELRVKPWVLWL